MRKSSIILLILACIVPYALSIETGSSIWIDPFNATVADDINLSYEGSVIQNITNIDEYAINFSINGISQGYIVPKMASYLKLDYPNTMNGSAINDFNTSWGHDAALNFLPTQYNGTISGASWVNGHIDSSALDFDGTDNYVDINDNGYIPESIASGDSAATGIRFKPDGKRFYMTGQSTDSIREYNMTEAWNITTATYIRNYVYSAYEGGANDLVISPDGTLFYILGQGGGTDDITMFYASTAWDVSTLSYISGGEFITNNQETGTTGMAFNDDGLKMFVVGIDTDTVYEYSLEDAYNVTTASYTGNNFSVASEELNPFQIEFNSAGTKMFIFGDSGLDISVYTLTAWDITTAVFSGITFYTGNEGTQTGSGAFKPDGTHLYTVESTTSDKTWNYKLPTAWSFTNPVYENGFTVSAWIKPDSVGETAGRIFSKESTNTAGNGFSFEVAGTAPNGRLHSYINGVAGQCASGSIVYDGSWYYATMTLSSTGYMNIYKNGVLCLTNSYIAKPETITANLNLRIGNRAGFTDRTFDGSIDNVRVWTRVLTAAEIAREMNNARPYDAKDIYLSLDLEEGTGTNTEDLKYFTVGYNSEGTALNYNGDSGDPNSWSYFIINSNVWYENVTSIGFWLRPIDVNQEMNLFKMAYSGDEEGAYILANGTVSYIYDIGDYLFSGTDHYDFDYNVVENTWQHLFFVRNESHVRLYVNGIFNSEVAAEMAEIDWRDIYTFGYLGHDAQYLYGHLDNVRFYVDELTALQVSLIYNDFLMLDESNYVINDYVTFTSEAVNYTNLYTDENNLNFTVLSSVSYDNPTNEGIYNDYLLDITKISSLQNAEANLTYDSTEYSTVKSSTVSEYSFNGTVGIPLTATDETRDFFFTYFLTGVDGITVELNTSTLTQNLTSITSLLSPVVVYEPDTFIGTVQSYEFILPIVTGLSDVNYANLTYDSTEYSTAETTTGSNFTFIKYLDFPFTESSQNNSLYFTYEIESPLGDLLELNTSVLYQYLSATILTSCTNSSTYALYLGVYDENLLTAIDQSNIKGTLTYYINNSLQNKTYSFDTTIILNPTLTGETDVLDDWVYIAGRTTGSSTDIETDFTVKKDSIVSSVYNRGSLSSCTGVNISIYQGECQSGTLLAEKTATADGYYYYANFTLSDYENSTLLTPLNNYCIHQEKTSSCYPISTSVPESDDSDILSVSSSEIGHYGYFEIRALGYIQTSAKVCIAPSDANITADAIFQYTGGTDGYTQYWYLFQQELTSSPLSLFMYNYNETTETSSITQTLKESEFSVLPNIWGKLYRFYTGEGLWRNVQQLVTDSKGQGYWHIREEDTIYKAEYYYPNSTLIWETGNMAFKCPLYSDCVVDTSTYTANDFSSIWEDVLYSITPHSDIGSSALEANQNHTITLLTTSLSSKLVYTKLSFSYNGTSYSDTDYNPSSGNATVEFFVPSVNSPITFYVTFEISQEDEGVLTLRRRYTVYPENTYPSFYLAMQNFGTHMSSPMLMFISILIAVAICGTIAGVGLSNAPIITSIFMAVLGMFVFFAWFPLWLFVLLLVPALFIGYLGRDS